MWDNKRGTSDTLNSSVANWGGLTIEDIITSNVEGWMQNGNKNGFKMGGMYATANGSGKLPYQDGIRKPGFFNIPICQFHSENWATKVTPYGYAYGNIDENNPNFPCKE